MPDFLPDFSTHVSASGSLCVSVVFVCGVRSRPESVPFRVSVQSSNTDIKGYYFSLWQALLPVSVPLIHLFNCFSYCGFTESFEIRKFVLSNAVLQGCFGLRQYKTPESPWIL